MRDITSIWKTNELRRNKPIPVDEAKAGKLLEFLYLLWHSCACSDEKTMHVRLTHCVAVPLESCPSLFTLC